MAKLGTLNIAITASAKGVAKALARVRKGVAGLAKKAVSLPGLAAVGGGIFAAKEVLGVADAYVDLDTRLTSLLGTTENAANAQEELFQLSQRTGTAMSANANAFTKLSIASGMTGLSVEENITVLEGLNKIFAISGASALDTSIAMRQLGQSLASGRLQGDEFRSIAEATPMLLVKLSKQLGVAVGDLKKMGSEGELTSEILGEAFLAIANDSEIAMAELPKTSARAFQRIINSAQRLWDHINDNTGLIGAIADKFDEVAVWIEANEYRFIEWAQNMKNWIIDNAPGMKEQLMSVFREVSNLVQELWPPILDLLRQMIPIIQQVLPWVAKLVGSITTAIDWWSKLARDLEEQDLGAEIRASAERKMAEETEQKAKEKIEKEIRERGASGGGGVSITNNISEKMNRSDLARLSTDQARQATRA
jgi:tape measure domain-containing protein